jgi:hypothetical protein
MKSYQAMILPVVKDTFKSSKVSIADVARKFRKGVVIGMTRHNPDNSTTEVFVLNDTNLGFKVGETYTVGHAKNGRPYGPHSVNFVQPYAFKNGVLVLDGADTGTCAYSDALDLTAVAFTLEA